MLGKSSHYKALPIAADTTTVIQGSHIGGFLCTTTGTITINRIDEGITTVIVDELPVTAGQWVDLPFYVGTDARSNIVTTGAAGTLAVS